MNSNGNMRKNIGRCPTRTRKPMAPGLTITLAELSLANKKKAILLTLPPDLAARVDQAAKELGVIRLEFIRESLRRNLRHFELRERPILRQLKEQAYK